MFVSNHKSQPSDHRFTRSRARFALAEGRPRQLDAYDPRPSRWNPYPPSAWPVSPGVRFREMLRMVPIDLQPPPSTEWTTLLKAMNREDHVITGSMIATLGGTGLAATFTVSELFGATACAVFALMAAGTLVTRSDRLPWLLVCGGVVGVLQLLGDWLHVTYFHTVVYTDHFGFRLLASPSYMPIAWCAIVVQIGYLALRLREAWPPWVIVSTITTGAVLLALWIEECATSAQAWRTTGSLVIYRTPLFIVLSYAGSMFAVATLALTYYRPRFWGGAVLAGFFASAGITFWSVFWFALLG